MIPQQYPGCFLRAEPCLSPHVSQEDTPIHYPEDDGGSQGPLCPLDSNLSHFILVEPGTPGKGDDLAELRLRLEEHISQQRTGYGGEAPTCWGSCHEQQWGGALGRRT